MKKHIILLIFLLGTVASGAQQAGSGHALKLHYDKPAEFFEEAMVIGNGTMGAIVYGRTDTEHISLNDITLWSGEPESMQNSMDATEGAQALAEVRKALKEGNYSAADKLNRQLQGRYSKMYQPLGDVEIEYVGRTASAMDSYSRWLDITDATLHTRFKRDGYTTECEYFATAPDSGIVVRITTDNPQGLRLRLRLSSQMPSNTEGRQDILSVEGYAPYTSMAAYYDGEKEKRTFSPDRGIHFRTIVKVDGSHVTHEKDGSLSIEGDKEVKIFIANVTSFNGFDRNPTTEGKNYRELAERRIENLASHPYEELRQRHTNDYKSLFDRLSLTLHGEETTDFSNTPTDVQLKAYTDERIFNPELETLYFQYGRYLLISCSRTDGVPANLQGLWNEKVLPPWSCNYTTNINVEENYWAAETANLPELHIPLLSWMKALRKSGERTARNYYGVKQGWCLGHNSDIWGTTNPVGEHLDDAMWACWNMGGAWLSTHIWEHYAFTLDRDFLEEYYPILKGAAEFCMEWLMPLEMMTGEEKDGKYLVTAPSTSPENQFIDPATSEAHATMFGGSADIAMIRECLIDTRLATIELEENTDFIEKLDSTIARLLPYKIGKKGNLQEWFYDWKDRDPQHRHQSHLFGLYPGNNFTDGIHSQEILHKAAAKTLEIKGDKTTGWSTGWRINLYARLHEGERAYHIYRKLLNYITPDGYKGPDRRRGGGTYPNLLDAHTPFQIDGNFGGCAGVLEMLLQSRYGEIPEIELLPALPSRWQNGELKGARARGGITVDMKWENGRVTEYTLHALRDTQVSIKVNGQTKTHMVLAKHP